MDSSIILDILGNENRRKILQILSDRPYYVSEISRKLEVGPKAIINHLSLLEEVGLIECHFDSNRRKYFSISHNLYLEITLSPYSYVTSIRSFSSRKDNGLISKNSVDQTSESLIEKNKQIQNLRLEINKLVSRKNELRDDLIKIMNECGQIIQEITQNHTESKILYELLIGPRELATISYNLGIEPDIVKVYLSALYDRNLIEFQIINGTKYWKISEKGE
ncbi:ArsR/SmtB family transcription factor [Methanosalsum natronophilum]|uniref:ArsR/SmtB family transcription factor n=1 Tax=Methanosalsum natronophilum TaxID=768733 RepID=UPI0021670585|nr:ArsR family transcriptional regulator [Methanosalsum natronophilum]MCS3923132.1 ArsR family transcriptional regulator [Methanosalsum natronophilum]